MKTRFEDPSEAMLLSASKDEWIAMETAAKYAFQHKEGVAENWREIAGYSRPYLRKYDDWPSRKKR